MVSEYKGADSGGVPDLFVSMPATCRDVSDELLDFMWYRGMSIPEVAAAAGISEKAAEDLIRKGKGTSADLLAPERGPAARADATADAGGDEPAGVDAAVAHRVARRGA